jgi:N-methylhydantoinase A
LCHAQRDAASSGSLSASVDRPAAAAVECGHSKVSCGRARKYPEWTSVRGAYHRFVNRKGGELASQRRLAVDIGGTFTDVVLEVPGKRHSKKVLTTPRAPETGFMQGVLDILAETGLSLSQIDVIVHGTTLATNAIIERKGAKVALVATEGFRDILEIADESRFDQYDLYIERPPALVPRDLRFTVRERVDATGSVRVALEKKSITSLLSQLKEAGIDSVAVALMHSYANGTHERRIADAIRDALPGVSLTLSSECCPEIREYERTSTTCANAYVQPMMAGYLERLNGALHKDGFRGTLYLVTSGGGLTTPAAAAQFPVRLVESGPAGGAIMAGTVARQCQERKALSFDMGGTTAKICLLDEFTPQVSRAFEVARTARFIKGSGLPLRIPVIELVEIGAGGGSIARVDHLGRLTIGPDSAGSEPGPACYARGGKDATVTDADVVLGRIDPATFAGGNVALDVGQARQEIADSIGAVLDMDTHVAAFGISEIVGETMAGAARVHAIELGKTISDYTMIAFGGAAPLHAARLAERLDITRIIVPANAGVGSAVGFLRAPVAFESIHSLYMRHDRFEAASANQLIGDLAAEARAIVSSTALDENITEKRTVYMRYIGQGHEIPVPLPNRALATDDAAMLRQQFEAIYEQMFARFIPGAALEILTWSVVASAPTPAEVISEVIPKIRAATPKGARRVYDEGKLADVPVYWRQDLAPGDTLTGPAIIAEDQTSTLVPPRFTASIHRSNAIVMEKLA